MLKHNIRSNNSCSVFIDIRYFDSVLKNFQANAVGVRLLCSVALLLWFWWAIVPFDCWLIFFDHHFDCMADSNDLYYCLSDQDFVMVLSGRYGSLFQDNTCTISLPLLNIKKTRPSRTFWTISSRVKILETTMVSGWLHSTGWVSSFEIQVGRVEWRSVFICLISWTGRGRDGQFRPWRHYQDPRTTTCKSYSRLILV